MLFFRFQLLPSGTPRSLVAVVDKPLTITKILLKKKPTITLNTYLYVFTISHSIGNEKEG